MEGSVILGVYGVHFSETHNFQFRHDIKFFHKTKLFSFFPSQFFSDHVTRNTNIFLFGFVCCYFDVQFLYIEIIDFFFLN